MCVVTASLRNTRGFTSASVSRLHACLPLVCMLHARPPLVISAHLGRGQTVWREAPAPSVYSFAATVMDPSRDMPKYCVWRRGGNPRWAWRWSRKSWCLPRSWNSGQSRPRMTQPMDYRGEHTAPVRYGGPAPRQQNVPQPVACSSLAGAGAGKTGRTDCR